ncbi:MULTISPECIES: enoyl-[acyl-carrier-protein] reductase FabK [Globicatella]|uniref:Probable nitronate monooxygenase n=2 Tax=Globicatella sulfidifaciens TaxID=136093 RepID=A0A1T4LC43_9LACT|nr:MULTISPECIES: enoyl-[acyl-carrier-protein] reductase FabK [Globicatella]NLJ18943.1 enoyl-[acyl-carrier-protein] reductase FabK [Globicatella sulfidifaciens]WPC08737.1 enoyl-[acyl-carrier-protein] reductase FabK [Globicatella sp. PHS-GS-PNBC-21-1553]SJZ52270.1 enoyl-[acyl-carrier protein] reductase II [Globicatella sulfidifaciens DSM 15739]HJF16640.1 enoyl-[acyl-carrier-protein] reductase FabK [Globicatella sulfidifaciens]
MQTAITKLLNIKYPIIQGAMAWVADADLASAVSNAGGLGIIGTGHDPVEVVREKVETMKNKTNQPFAVNVMLLNPHVEEVVDYLVNSGVKIITTGAGNPGKYMERFKEAGIVVIPVVASVALAKRMERIGADAVVVEGMEAGGHIGKQTTLALVPQIVDAVDIPVIAAGGFGDGRSLAAALMLGVEAIQVGTRFVVANESNAHPNFKAAILKATDIDTVVTGTITGHPVRVLRNRLTKEYLALEKSITSQEQPDLSVLEDLGKGALRRAVVEGDVNTGSMMAGQIAGLIKKEQSCQEIIEEYVNEAKAVFQTKQSYFN